MRKARHENLKLTVSNYLMRRNYTTSEISFRRSDFSRGMTLKEFDQEERLKSIMSQENIISFNNVGVDVTAVDQQMSRFKTWLGSMSELVNKQLSPIVPIAVAHFYIEAVADGANRILAYKFLKRHYTPLMHPNELLDDLIATGINNEVVTKPSIVKFRSEKTIMPASRQSIDALQKYISSSNHVLVLQMVSQCIHFVSRSTCAREDSTDDSQSVSMTVSMTQPEGPSGHKSIGDDDPDIEMYVEALRTAIEDVENGPLFPNPMRVFNIMNCEKNPIACAALGSKSMYLAAGLETSSVSIWSLTEDCLATGRSAEKLFGHTGPIRSLAWLGNNGVVSASVDSDIRLWTPETYSCASVYRGHKGFVYALAASPLNTYFASGCSDLTVKLWSPEFAFPLRSYCAHTQAPACLDFHPNGHYLASGARDNTVRLWAANEGRLLRLYTGHRAGVRCVSFSPDGKSLASGGSEVAVRIWDLAQGTCRLELPAPCAGVNVIMWSEDSSVLAFSSSDGTVSEWSVLGEPRLMATYKTGCLAILALCFTAHNITCVGTNY